MCLNQNAFSALGRSRRVLSLFPALSHALRVPGLPVVPTFAGLVPACRSPLARVPDFSATVPPCGRVPRRSPASLLGCSCLVLKRLLLQPRGHLRWRPAVPSCAVTSPSSRLLANASSSGSQFPLLRLPFYFSLVGSSPADIAAGAVLLLLPLWLLCFRPQSLSLAPGLYSASYP